MRKDRLSDLKRREALYGSHALFMVTGRPDITKEYLIKYCGFSPKEADNEVMWANLWTEAYPEYTYKGGHRDLEFYSKLGGTG